MKTIFKFILTMRPARALLAASLIFFGANAFCAQKKSIVCAAFPEYDWTLNVLGNDSANFSVTLLQKNGTDLHSYQPSIKDIAKIASCDLLIFAGGESQEWIEKAAQNASNKDQRTINMLESLGPLAKEEEAVEGMQAEEEEDEDEIEYDEHVWLSLKNAALIVEEIAKNVGALDPAQKKSYEQNAARYAQKLKALDGEFQKAVLAASKKTLLFGDRYPFRYLSDDYGLKYYAAFPGCSAESEASFETIIFLSKKLDELDLNAVLTIEKSDKKIARTIVQNSKKKNQKILEMDSLQSVAEKEIKGGKTYLSAMKSNLEIVKEALK